MNPLSPAKSERVELQGQAFRAFRYLLASLRANNTFWNKLAVTSDRSQPPPFSPLLSANPSLSFFFPFFSRNLIKFPIPPPPILPFTFISPVSGT